MNPIEYYLQTNFELRDFISNKLLEVDYIENKTVCDIVIEIMTKGSYMKKTSCYIDENHKIIRY